MPRDSFFKMNKFIRFNNESRRSQSFTKDTSVHICEIIETFEANWLLTIPRDRAQHLMSNYVSR